MAGLTIKVLLWMQKHISLHCNANNLVLKILQHDKIWGTIPLPRSKFWGDKCPRDLLSCISVIRILVHLVKEQNDVSKWMAILFVKNYWYWARFARVIWKCNTGLFFSDSHGSTACTLGLPCWNVTTGFKLWAYMVVLEIPIVSAQAYEQFSASNSVVNLWLLKL